MSATDLRFAFSEELVRLAAKNERIWAVTSDARGSSTLSAFAGAYPERFVECGIAEQNEVGVAAGLAISGCVPFVGAPAAFLSARAVEQVKIDLAYSGACVNLVGVSGGMAYGVAGMTHFSVNDTAVFRSFDGIQVYIPCDAYQVRQITRIMAQGSSPAYMRLGRSPFPDVYTGTEDIRPGAAAELAHGSDLTIIANGRMVRPALDAARALAERGIRARVLDMFCVKPFDTDAVVRAARETGRIVTAEEGVRAGGIGEAAAAAVAEACPVPMRILALPDEHLVCGSEDEINAAYGLTAEGIVRAALSLI